MRERADYCHYYLYSLGKWGFAGVHTLLLDGAMQATLLWTDKIDQVWTARTLQEARDMKRDVRHMISNGAWNGTNRPLKIVPLKVIPESQKENLKWD